LVFNRPIGLFLSVEVFIWSFMLTLYYNPMSPNARRVWLALLEKKLPFEPVVINLDGDQLQPAFLEVNPFHHIPVLVDDGFRIVESLAILDYLEAKYPLPALLPSEPQALATVRMTQMVISNELFPIVISLIYESEDSPQFEQAKQKIEPMLSFLTELLGDRPYFGSQQLTLADIVAGTVVPLLPRLGVTLDRHPALAAWCQRLMAREVWQKTQISSENLEAFKHRVRVLVKLRRRELTRR
jgi:glutathione S-transferase